jgi:hypothetical protein
MPRVPLFLTFLLPAFLGAQGGTLRIRADGASTPDSVQHTQMPPGWHVTTGPGAILFNPVNSASGRFAVTVEVHLFPGTSQEGYGVFIGGSGLDGPQASYLAFVARRDGSAGIERVTGSARTWIMPWTPNGAVKPHTGGDGTAFNTLRMSVEPDSVRFEANGTRVAALARGDLPVDGTFGLRAGSGVNLHVTNLDLTQRYAPARGARK